MNWLMWDKFRVDILLRTSLIPIFRMNEAYLGFYCYNPNKEIAIGIYSLMLFIKMYLFYLFTSKASLLTTISCICILDM